MAAEAAAPATPTAAPAAANEAVERAALIAELDSDASDDAEEASPAQAGKDDEQQEGDEPAEGEESDEEGGEDEAEESPELQTADEFRDHVKSLLESGDMRKVEEALGLEKGALKINGAKLRYVQRQLAEADRKSGEAANVAREANELKEAARNFYGPFVQAKQSFQSGTPQGVMAAARAVEGHFGVPLAVFVEHVLKAGKGETQTIATQQPQTNAEIEALKAQNAQILEMLRNSQNQTQAQVAEQRHIATITTKLKGTELAKLKDGPQLVYDAIKGSYDANLRGYKLDLPKAIKAVLADPATKWKLHELKTAKTGKTAAAVPPKPNGKVSPVKRPAAAGGEKLTRQQQEAAEKAAIIAELEAEERRQERTQRRGKK